MFIIQYSHPTTRQSAMQTLDSRHVNRLLTHLAKFEHEILAVYEQGTPITKRTRLQLAEMKQSNLSRAAKNFAAQAQRVNSPA